MGIEVEKMGIKPVYGRLAGRSEPKLGFIVMSTIKKRRDSHPKKV